MNIEELIKQEESENLEFKKSLSEWKEIIKTVSSFANTKGGNILVGISDKMEIVGLRIGKKTIEDLANKIKENTDPKIFPSMSVEKINGKDTILIKVGESKSKPVFAFDRAYKRVGKSTVRASSEEIRNLALEGRKVYWDEQICVAALEDIDKEKVRWFLRKAKFERRLGIDPSISIRDALERLNLINNGKLTNAAILLFGKNPQKFFLPAEVRCARFKGTKPLEFIDMKVFGENVIDQREDALEFVKEHIKLHAEIKGTERVEKWEYPIEAIREGITNAICHRDYEVAGNVQIRIFDDRIEIWGCGPLPEPLTPEDLKRKHKSILRNPLIGKCFFLIKYIEEWGTGTNRIVEWCLKHNLPEPIFEEVSGSLVVTLRKYRISEEGLEKLNERQKKMAEHLKVHKKITRSQYVKLTNCSERTAFRDLEELLKNRIVARKGGGKNTYYELI